MNRQPNERIVLSKEQIERLRNQLKRLVLEFEETGVLQKVRWTTQFVCGLTYK